MFKNNSALVSLTCALLAVCSGLWGCGGSDSENAKSNSSSAAKASAAEKDSRWEYSMLNGSKIAHMRTSLTPIAGATAENAPAWVEEAEIHMSVQRFGQEAAPSAFYRGELSADGELLSFECTTQFGKKPKTFHGKVFARQLEIKQESGETTKIDCPAGVGGFLAVDFSLQEKPMTAGETRSLTHYDAITGSMVQEELVAKDVEETALLESSANLLRIEQISHLESDNQITQVLWATDQGQIRKSKALNTGSEQYLVSREQAQAPGSPSVDLAWATSVPLARPIQNAHDRVRARYRVRLESGNPTDVFPAGSGQTVTFVDDHTAELVVKAVRPMPFISGPAPSSETPPTSADVQPNAWIQSDDGKVINLAESVALDEVDSWKVAQALELMVHDQMRQRNFNTAMASAAEVAVSLEGDCTEHAVLLAAVLRARDIPARVAVGLVHTDTLGGFGFHMWNEAYIHGTWIPLDATLGRGGTGAGHIRLNSTSLAGSNGLTNLLPVAQVMGQLKIDVLDVD